MLKLNRRDFVVGAAGAALTPASSAFGQSQKFLTLRGGGNTGSWFIGTAVVSKIVNEKLPQYNMTATLGGGVKNPTDIQGGQAQYGFTMGRSAVEAFDGLAPFKAKHGDIRVMCSFFPTYMIIVTPQRTGIKTFRDLIGKRVGPGTRAFTTSQMFEDLLKLDGKSLKDVQPFFLNYADANQAFQDGQIDVVMAMTGNPSPQYLELDTLVKIAVVSIDEDILKQFIEQRPGYTRGVIPAGSYPNWKHDAVTLQSPTIMITRADSPADEVYEITKTVFENRKDIVDAYPAYSAFQKETAASEGFGHVPLHEGAIRYWKEIGALK
jgi:TRAP transporter TAXI family solute receptor